MSQLVADLSSVACLLLWDLFGYESSIQPAFSTRQSMIHTAMLLRQTLIMSIACEL